MKCELENELYIPPQVWILMISLGHWFAIKEQFPNWWADLAIQDTEAILMLFVDERREFLKGKRK